jgi:nucleotide-binding universal stress UspA family protein
MPPRIMPIGVGPAAGYVPPAVINDVWKAAREQAAGEMERVVRIARAGGVRVTTMIADGPAAQAVVRAAERRRAGLIVLGTHGRTGVKRFLLGSVAERVVRTARQPVLTVAGA